MKCGVIFDLDGTLLDTLEDLKDSVNHALTVFGYPCRTLEEVRRFVGNGIGELVRRAVPTGADAEPVLAVFRTYYVDHCRVKTAPYKGIMAALEVLGKQYPLAIVSNKADSAVKALCDELFPGIYALGERADCPRKPAADMVRKAMAAMGVDGCLYIGDSEVDIATAKNAAVPCLSVLWGFRKQEELEAAGGTRYCDTPEKLPQMTEDILREVYGK